MATYKCFTRLMLPVESMELQAEWVQEKGTLQMEISFPACKFQELLLTVSNHKMAYKLPFYITSLILF